ncbi:MAG TPA: histidine phosphatase family protein [Flavobacteriales bacterium]
MRTIYLVRHAKSSWADPGMADFDRPLNERGLRDAPVMAERFLERNEPVDLLVSSPAARALATARCFANVLGIERIVEVERIYEAHQKALRGVLEELPDEARHVMLFGHNPGFTVLAEELSGERIGDLPTCAIVRIDLMADRWREVSAGTGTLVWADAPKDDR